MATAIFVKTESADYYLWCVAETLDKKGVETFLRKELDEEYDYISDLMVEHDG